jgi:type IV secretory pathway VirB10-like protein
LPNAINLSRPTETRGRHLNKPLIGAGVLLLLGVVMWILLPSFQSRAPAHHRTSGFIMSTMVKPSKALSQLRDSYNGDSLESQPSPVTTPPPVVDRSEEERLRKENAQLRELLSRVPKAEPKPVTPAVTHDNGEAKRLAEERRKQQQADRKLVVWKAPEDKDASSQILQVKHPLTPYSLAPGWKIPCITEGPVSNEVPGSFTVRVRQPVYDSRTGMHVVIPQETTIVAAPRGNAVLYGDGRLGIGLQTLSFPDASYVKLSSATVGNQEGHSGFSDQVDRRLGSLFASILLTGVLRSGTSLVPGGGYNDPLSRAGNTIASESTSQGEKQVKQFLRTEPILTIRAGYECLIMLEDNVNLTRAWP